MGEKWGNRDDQLLSMQCTFGVRFSFTLHLLWFKGWWVQNTAEAGWQGPAAPSARQWAHRAHPSTRFWAGNSKSVLGHRENGKFPNDAVLL